MGFLSKSFRLRLARLGMSAGLAMTVACQALANPEGPTVRHGQVNISPGTHAQIQQLTDRAIVDWNSFSVGRNESLVFLQPSQLSVILNRVTGGDPSAILGQLSANGNVFLINPNGILFGPDSVVNVGGLVASTLNLNDDDFLSGNYRFFDDSSGNLGAVVNQGRITISDGGYAVLTGPAVLNEGLIVAKGGKVVLASGERATLNLDGRDLVHFSLESSIGEGNVLLAPGALSETLANALGVNPALRADRLVQEADGSVRMVRSSGTLVQAGTVSVDGNDGIDAGSIILDSTDVTILADGSVTSASGVGADSGGGEILVLSDMDGERSFGFTDVHTGALISATGGASGDAGFIEVSGNRLNLHGEVDLTAPNGVAGTFLLDPQTYTIIDGDNMPTTVGDFITVGDQYFNTLTGTTLVISSTGDVIFDLGIDGNNPTNDGVMSFLNLSGNRVNLTINSGTDPDPDGIIDFGDDGITVSGLNSMNLNSEGGVLFGDSRVVVNGNVNIDSVGAIQLQTGTLLVTNDGDITLDGENGVDLGSGFINPGAGGGSTGFLHILSDRDIDLGTSSITVNANNEINPLSITAGDPLDLLAIPADLILGGAQISVVQTGGASGVQGLILTATRDIDFGSSDLTYSHNRSSSGTYEDRISAGGNIFSSAAPDGDPGNFLNNYVITGDTGPLLMTAGGSIVLTDLFLDVNEVDGNIFRDTTIAANGGVLDLGNSEIDIETALTLSSSSDIIFNSPTLTTRNNGDLDIQAGGNVTLNNGTLNSQGFLHISGDGDVSLGSSSLIVDAGAGEINPLSITAGDPLNIMAPPADLLLGDAQMLINAVGSASDVQGLVLTATGDIDFGSSDLTFSQNRSTSGTYQDRIIAGGDIFTSAAPDGDPGNFLNNYVITGDTGPLLMTAGGSIVLTDLFLDVNEVDGNIFRDTTIAANGGVLDLGNSEIDIETALTLSSSSDIIFNSPTLTTYNGGNLDIDAGGYVSVVEGTLSSLGHLHITGDHGVSLGDSTLTVNSTGPINPLSITAGDAMSPPADLLLGNAQMTVTTVGGASGVQGLFLTATGDIDLGSSDLTYSHDRSGGGIYQDRINAGGSIFSSVAPDGNPNTFVNNYSVTGDSGEFTMTAGTDILLPDMRLVVDEFEGQTQNVVLTAEAGQMFLGESEIVALDGDVRLQASGLLDLDSSRLTTVDQLVLSSNTAVSANGSGFTAPDIEVFGFDPMTMVPGGAVNGDVELDLAITTLVDLTVLATGNVDITNTGGGTIRADAIGGVGLSSTNGDVSVVTDGNLASGSGTDVFAANTVNLVAANIGIGSPFQVEGSKVALDTSSDAGSVMNVEVLGTTTSFLSVAGNDSVIDVREVNSGGLLEVNANILDLPLLGIEEILVSNVNGLTLDSLVIGPDQSVGIKALGGDITATSNNSVNLSGALALEASGDVGENLLPITVAGGTLAIDSGGQVFVEGTGPALTIGTVLFDQDPSVPQKSVAGISATDDIVVVLTGSGPTQLVQEADIATTGGNVALVAVEGGLVQTSGVVRGGDVVLKADGNVGEYDGTNVLSEFGVEAERLILDIGGDAIVDQQTGDLTIAQQATVGGNLFTATGAGGDLRVRNSGGDLTLEADLDSGGEAALLTGDNLTVTQGGLANSVFLNGSLTAADSLVVISAGDISQTSGVLTAPKIGLGAVGQIGSPSQPINVVTDEMALNPLNAQVSDPDGFTPVASVSAAGATVNQQTLPPPPPDPVVPPEPVIPPVIPPSAFEPPADFLPNEDFVAEAFSANNTEMVEEVFAILEMLDEPLVEEDPSRVPILWPEDEDFMQKKFRR